MHELDFPGCTNVREAFVVRGEVLGLDVMLLCTTGVCVIVLVSDR